MTGPRLHSATRRIPAAARQRLQNDHRDARALPDAQSTLSHDPSVEEASIALAALTRAVTHGSLRMDAPGVTDTIAQLEQVIADGLHAAAPMRNLSAAPAARIPQAIGAALRTASRIETRTGSGARGRQAFVRTLRHRLGGSRMGPALANTSPADFDAVLIAQGATPDEARSLRQAVETQLAMSFENDVQRHAMGAVHESMQYVDHAAIGYGAEFESMLDNLTSNGTQGERVLQGGQHFLRVLRELGVAGASELTQLVNETQIHPERRDALIQSMRPLLQGALAELSQDLHHTYEQLNTHFSDRLGGAYRMVPESRDAVAREHGLPADVFGDASQYGSLEAHAVRHAMRHAADERSSDRAVGGAVGDQVVGAGRLAGLASTATHVGLMYSLARSVIDISGSYAAADREAAMAFSGEGQIGRAEEIRAQADVEVGQVVRRQVEGRLVRAATQGVTAAAGDAARDVAETALQGQLGEQLGETVVEQATREGAEFIVNQADRRARRAVGQAAGFITDAVLHPEREQARRREREQERAQRRRGL